MDIAMTFNKAVALLSEPALSDDRGEEPFSIDQIIFSRTDKRGVIQSGNEVLRRLSGYSWERLIGAPHRVLRHPDTPKVVFAMLWRVIQQDKPMVAYIKNKSAHGGWYWVLSVVVPCEGGYFSARIKPSSPLFTQVKSIYAELGAAEAAQSLSPDATERLLLGRLADLGFGSYPAFMCGALEQELAARDAALGRSNAVQARSLSTITAGLKATEEKQKALLLEFDELQSIPTNMRIIASRLEPSGGPISAISDNYKFASTEISRRLEAFAGSDSNLCQTMSHSVADALFMTSVARLLAEVPKLFAKEDHSQTPIDFANEQALLAAVELSFRNQARAAMLAAEQVSGELNLASSEIRRMMLGLDTIRVMGRVESGRLGSSGVGLSSTVDQLDLRHAAISDQLQALMDLSASIKSAISAYERTAAAE
jgi:PAS domain S-box-containing protein